MRRNVRKFSKQFEKISKGGKALLTGVDPALLSDADLGDSNDGGGMGGAAGGRPGSQSRHHARSATASSVDDAEPGNAGGGAGAGGGGGGLAQGGASLRELYDMTHLLPRNTASGAHAAAAIIPVLAQLPGCVTSVLQRRGGGLLAEAAASASESRLGGDVLGRMVSGGGRLRSSRVVEGGGGAAPRRRSARRLHAWEADDAEEGEGGGGGGLEVEIEDGDGVADVDWSSAVSMSRRSSARSQRERVPPEATRDSPLVPLLLPPQGGSARRSPGRPRKDALGASALSSIAALPATAAAPAAQSQPHASLAGSKRPRPPSAARAFQLPGSGAPVRDDTFDAPGEGPAASPQLFSRRHGARSSPRLLVAGTVERASTDFNVGIASPHQASAAILLGVDSPVATAAASDGGGSAGMRPSPRFDAGEPMRRPAHNGVAAPPEGERGGAAAVPAAALAHPPKRGATYAAGGRQPQAPLLPSYGAATSTDTAAPATSKRRPHLTISVLAPPATAATGGSTSHVLLPPGGLMPPPSMAMAVHLDQPPHAAPPLYYPPPPYLAPPLTMAMQQHAQPSSIALTPAASALASAAPPGQPQPQLTPGTSAFLHLLPQMSPLGQTLPQRPHIAAVGPAAATSVDAADTALPYAAAAASLLQLSSPTSAASAAVVAATTAAVPPPITMQSSPRGESGGARPAGGGGGAAATSMPRDAAIRSRREYAAATAGGAPAGLLLPPGAGVAQPHTASRCPLLPESPGRALLDWAAEPPLSLGLRPAAQAAIGSSVPHRFIFDEGVSSSSSSSAAVMPAGGGGSSLR